MLVVQLRTESNCNVLEQNISVLRIRSFAYLFHIYPRVTKTASDASY